MKIEDIEAFIADHIGALPLAERVQAINRLRSKIHEVSPFASEPVDFVRWVPAPEVVANNYNPNSVAPPEMELLRVSIMADGYTQPIVTYPDGDKFTVVDGFHRNRVGKECHDVHARVHGYLPVVRIRETQSDLTDRMASTIRHNRARGKHAVDAMSDIVIELKRRNWSDEKISKNLGMEPDEVLRLCQITGLAELFSDQEFSKSWDVADLEDEYGELSEDGDVVTIQENRILHTWDKWECYRAGFYGVHPPEGMSKEDCEETYRQFLADMAAFERGLERVTSEWKNSCEHYLTNERMNRIAWLGQASLCIERGIPAVFRGGYNLLAEDQKYQADQLALKWLNTWLERNGRQALMLMEASSKTEADLY